VVDAEDEMEEATIGALTNMAIAIAANRNVVTALTEANYRLVKQLAERSTELKSIKEMLKKEHI
jgi:hypothetical protein